MPPAATVTTAMAAAAKNGAARRRAVKLRPGSQREPRNLVIVADDDVAVGVGGMRPQHIGKLSPAHVGIGRLDQLRAADLLETGWQELRDHQFAAIVVDEVAIAIPDEERGAPRRVLFQERVGLPHELARGGLEAAKLPVVVDAVHVY